MPATLYRVECSACPFSACTNSRYEAQRFRQFHENWNSDERQADGRHVHQPKVHAQVEFAGLPESQTILDAIGVLA